MVNPIPDGYHTLTPYLFIKGAAEAIEFYKKGLGAEEIMVMKDDDGSIEHAELKIGNSMLMVSEVKPDWGTVSPKGIEGSTSSLYVYVEDVDAVFQRAIDAGGVAKHGGVQDMFWGDRTGAFVDPFGHDWCIGTHKEDLTPEKIMEKKAAWLASMQQG